MDEAHPVVEIPPLVSVWTFAQWLSNRAISPLLSFPLRAIPLLDEILNEALTHAVL